MILAGIVLVVAGVVALFVKGGDDEPRALPTAPSPGLTLSPPASTEEPTRRPPRTRRPRETRPPTPEPTSARSPLPPRERAEQAPNLPRSGVGSSALGGVLLGAAVALARANGSRRRLGRW